MNIAGKKVAYITLGCKLNFSETSTIRHSLEKEGTETVADKEGADIFVINTCSVTDMAEKKGRQLIRKIIHHNPGAYIVVVGCYAQLRAKEIMAIDGVSLVLGAGEKFNVAHYLQHLEEQRTTILYHSVRSGTTVPFANVYPRSEVASGKLATAAPLSK